MVSECELDKFQALCICGTRLTSARRLPRPRIWVLGRDMGVKDGGVACSAKPEHKKNEFGD
ncbi:hypothetical protein SLEP1_g22192 [Rubroshorea leprosula]|uniref:Uncharacterized protein n=1 Tax=Rubroshorea leprosula TaxID=152421 RepID=A0AAV5JBH0_9ROSI|nr:hypothetical protein SLEP1_g22192 [Rubroshorea leprosula]